MWVRRRRANTGVEIAPRSDDIIVEKYDVANVRLRRRSQGYWRYRRVFRAALARTLPPISRLASTTLATNTRLNAGGPVLLAALREARSFVRGRVAEAPPQPAGCQAPLLVAAYNQLLETSVIDATS